MLTSHQQDDASCHGDASFTEPVAAGAGGALHAHAGHAQTCDGHDDAHDHQGASGLEGTCSQRTPSLNMRRKHKETSADSLRG